MTDADLLAFCRRDLKRYGCSECDGRGYIAVDASNANETHVDTPDCEECSGTGIDPAALRDLRALVEAETGPYREALKPFAEAYTDVPRHWRDEWPISDAGSRRISVRHLRQASDLLELYRKGPQNG